MTGEKIAKKRDAMAVIRSPRMTHWDELAPLFTQYRSVYDSCDGDINPGDWQFDSVPKQAINTCANGLASLVFAREEEFSEYGAPLGLKGKDGYDDAERWCRKSSETHQIYLQNSNFWEEMQECLLELPWVGTMALFCGGYQPDKDELFFRHIPVGTYYIAENYKGYVDTLYRDLEYTADQAAEEYGEDNLPQEIRSKVGQALGSTEKFKFIHAVEPREIPPKKGKRKKKEKPFASYVVYEGDKSIVQEDGFDSFPYAVVRFRKQRSNPWGWGPASLVIGEARQLNKLNELADAATEISVFPPAVVHPDMEGSIDFGALGLNFFPSGYAGGTDAVKQLPINNRLDQCNVRMQQKEAKINEALFVDMFKMFALRSQQPGEITAFEASQMLAEKMAQFSPVYGRLISEGGDVIMRRDFETLLAAGKFEEPIPQAMLDLSPTGKVEGFAEPSIIYKNKIVLAFQQQKNGSIPPVLGLVNQLLSTNPELAPMILAGLEPAKMFREAARNAGFPEDWLPPDAVLNERIAAIAKQQQEQHEAAMLQQGAKTLADAGKAPQGAMQGVSQAING